MVSRVPMLDANSKIPDRFLPDQYASTPVATIIEYAGSSIPSDYLLCDGSAVSRTAYAELFAVIGTIYGVGDGSTTFNLPDKKGRVGMGLSGSADFPSLGYQAGAKNHSHTLSDAGQAQMAVAAATPAILSRRIPATAWAPSHVISTALSVTSGTGTQAIATALQGSTDAASGLPPYITLNYAIKYRLGLPRGSYDKRMIGEISQWGGSAPPAGYLSCDGSAVSRAGYPDLFAALGTTFGAGDGSTTFNLPNSPAGTIVSASGTAAQTGTTGAALIYTGMTITLPPGSWELEGGINTQSTVLDAQAAAMYSVTGSAEVPGTRGDVQVIGAPPAAGGLRTRTIVVTLFATTQIRMMVIPNGSSVPSVVASAAGVASAPSAWIDARRQPYNQAKSIINASPVPLLSSLPSDTKGLRLIGEMLPWAGAGLPIGYLECNGQLVSRTTYADLFAALGTAHGVGDGSTTFALPDLKGRVPVGLDPAQAEFNTLGGQGGSKTVTLDLTQIPSHSHPVAYTISGTYGAGPAGSSTYQVIGSTGTTQPSGGGGAHQNLQPYTVLRWVIKALWAATEVSPNAAHTHRVINLAGISRGTAAASGGVDGDLYLKYS